MPLKATAHIEAMSAFALANEDILLLAEHAGEMLADIKAAWHAAAAPKSYSSWREESWVWMRLSGPRLAEAMSALCALDMRPQKLGADDIAQTRVGHIEAMMFYSPAGFDILFDIAASAYFARAVAAVARHTAQRTFMTRPQGTIAPILTPFEDDGRIARDLWISHAKWVLGQGTHFLSPFGTTGEALSVSLRERMQALEWLVEAGIAPDRLMPGTGVTALPESVELSAHAVGLGCAAVMVLPSFFYTGAGDNGQARYYSELIEKVAKPSMRVILYHIPQNSGVPVSPALTARLSKAFPDTVVAYKDSAGDWNNTAAVIAAAPNISVFPSSEAQLTKGLASGAAGCISATVNLNAAAIRRVYDTARKGEDVAEADAAIKAFRKVIQDAGLIPAMKAVLAVKSGDRRWLNLRAPHENATLENGQALLAALGSAAEHIGRH